MTNPELKRFAFPFYCPQNSSHRPDQSVYTIVAKTPDEAENILLGRLNVPGAWPKCPDCNTTLHYRTPPTETKPQPTS